MKQRKRKLNTSWRHERLMTGGGPAKTKTEDPVMDFMDAVNPNLDIELDCPFDSTAAFENEFNVNVQALNEDGNEETIDEEYQSMPSTSSKRLSPPCTSHLHRLEKQVTVNTRNIENIQDEKTLRLIKLREAIEQQRELH